MLHEYVATRSAAETTASLNRAYAAQPARVDAALTRAQLAALPDESR